MDATEGGGEAELRGRVAVGDSVHGITGDLRAALYVDEAEQLRGDFAADRQGRAGDGAGAERAPVGRSLGGGETRAVAAEHLGVGEQVMGGGDRLGALQVRVARQDHVGVGLSELHQSLEQRDEGFIGGVALVLDPQAHIGGDLVIARTGRMQLGGSWDALRERALDVHVHVLEVAAPLEFAGRDLLGDGVEAAQNGVTLALGQDTGLGQHRGMGLRAADILGPETMVERDRLAETQH